MNIDCATADDAGAIARIHVDGWRAAYAGILPAEYLASLSIERRTAMWTRVIAEGRPHLLVAREGATVIGWMSLGSCRDLDAPASRAEVWAIYVAPGAWSQGVGQALWQQARGLMHLWGHATCSLWVLEGNKRAIRFYRRAGFVADERSALVTELGGVQVHEKRYLCSVA